jgi:hypothetical protein
MSVFKSLLNSISKCFAENMLPATIKFVTTPISNKRVFRYSISAAVFGGIDFLIETHHMLKILEVEIQRYLKMKISYY